MNKDELEATIKMLERKKIEAESLLLYYDGSTDFLVDKINLIDENIAILKQELKNICHPLN